MKLKKILKTLDEVDEKFHELYVQEGDQFVLQGIEVEDSDLKKKIDEFRNSNRALHNEKLELTKKLSKFEGLQDFDPEEYKRGQEALKKLTALDDKKLADQGDFEALFSKRSESMRSDYEKRLSIKEDALKSAYQERDQLRGKLGSHLIDSEIQKAVLKVGAPRKGAMQDIISRARGIWRLDEQGNIIPKQVGSDETLFGKDGNVLTMDEWAATQLEEASFLFEPSRGGDAGGSTDKRGQEAVKYIDGNDPVAFGKNLEAIKQGKVQVRY